jgi:hypothetical protein
MPHNMNRRSFLRLLGVAPLAPLAAKIPALASPAPKVVNSGLSVKKLCEAALILNQADVPDDYGHALARAYRDALIREQDRYAWDALKSEWNAVEHRYKPGDSVTFNGENWTCVGIG